MSVSHLVLEENDLKRRVIIIGDVHGCFDELKQLLTTCLFDENSDTLIFVGDLVNKGPNSVDVVRFVRDLSLKGVAFSVRGNHDEALLANALLSPNFRPKKYAYIEQLNSEEIEWLQNLPYTIRLPMHNSIIVHAGLVPNVPLQDQQPSHMTKMRNLIYPSHVSLTDLPKFFVPEAIEQTDLGVPWAQMWSGPEHVYFGHDARRRLQQFQYATGLDTGCCYGRQLTAFILPDHQLVQIEALGQHVPVESD